MNPTDPQELVFLRTALTELPDYLLSSVLFWPLSGPFTGDLTRLTLGNFLLVLIRLKATETASQYSPELLSIQNQVVQLKNKEPGLWRRKAGQEFHARIQMWKNSLIEMMNDPGQCSAEFRHAVRWRVILELLKEELYPETATADLEVLQHLDDMLRRLCNPGQFLWASDLEASFPSNRFWFLYMNI